jgi:hypothetical protein
LYRSRGGHYDVYAGGLDHQNMWQVEMEFYAGTPARRNAVTHSSLLPSLSKRHGKYCSTGLIDTKGSDIYLLRLQALLARADGDDPAYAHLRGRYRDMARTLGYERHIAWAEAMP